MSYAPLSIQFSIAPKVSPAIKRSFAKVVMGSGVLWLKRKNEKDKINVLNLNNRFSVFKARILAFINLLGNLYGKSNFSFISGVFG